MSRALRIIIGLALIAYGVYSQNNWFYLGVIPLVLGLVNWCPLEKLFGSCKSGSCSTDSCCGTEKKDDNSSCCCK